MHCLIFVFSYTTCTLVFLGGNFRSHAIAHFESTCPSACRISELVGGDQQLGAWEDKNEHDSYFTVKQCENSAIMLSNFDYGQN